MADSSFMRDAEMSHALMCDVYRNAAGEDLLVFENGRGLLYASYADLVRRYEEDVKAAERRQPFNSIATMLPEGKSFVLKVNLGQCPSCRT